MFTTDKDLTFGSTVIPAGKYTLWTVPTPSGAQLIFNSETGQWGTDYHAEKDFARVNLTQTQASPAVEEFVIGVQPQSSGGVRGSPSTSWSGMGVAGVPGQASGAIR